MIGPMGTTALGWHLHGEKRRAQTLATLESSPFDRVRMAAFATRCSLDALEERVAELAAIGVDAELVLLHPGDGVSDVEAAVRYLREVVPRLAAHQSVWWSLAADPTRFPEISEHDWVCLAALVAEEDPGHHPLSISVDADSPLLWRAGFTHGSVTARSPRDAWVRTRDHHRPVLMDMCGHEGDADDPWRSLTAEEVVTQAWDGAVRRRYVTHGESYVDEAGLTWSTDGGTLTGAAVPRLGLLREVLAETPQEARHRDRDAPMLEVPGEFYLEFCGDHRFPERSYDVPGGRYEVEVIDTWEMTVTALGVREIGVPRADRPEGGTLTVPLPGTCGQAIRLRRRP
ncbi:DUF5605 domain-containing protein [Nonomuraea sp. K274]|uniref:DUF5605 domain-containing protein n=1 Tax=Nonomuraea cypriaca TaxID=1187855 RepID=A0A931EUJ7_9ACTN|nr:DUF5605 domain-containing protein [Nonomuraea cypriaca]MBF8184609.1 DUF5605 domain-containing protein [Nonomuraea cypriaca]